MSYSQKSIDAAGEAFLAYCTQDGFGQDEPETNFVDLIADLLLLAHHGGVGSMEEISERALMHAEMDLQEGWSG